MVRASDPRRLYLERTGLLAVRPDPPPPPSSSSSSSSQLLPSSRNRRRGTPAANHRPGDSQRGASDWKELKVKDGGPQDRAKSTTSLSGTLRASLANVLLTTNIHGKPRSDKPHLHMGIERGEDLAGLSPSPNTPCCPVSTSVTTTANATMRGRIKLTVVRAAWAAHFASSLILLSGLILWGNWNERKYIPVSASPSLVGCVRGFVNVMASSDRENGAVVCCEVLGDDDKYNLSYSGVSEISTETSTAAGFLDVCPNRSHEYTALPLSSRLSRFPEAWLLPLFPLLVQITVVTLVWLHSCFQQRRARKWRRPSQELFLRRVVPLLGRLGFYVVLFNFRGWVLYVALNRLEDSIVATDGPFHNNCWYATYLRSDQQHECVGRAFDFSDHMVLYFAQLLPVPLSEALYALLTVGSWTTSSDERRALLASSPARADHHAASTSTRSASRSFIPELVLILGLAYLYLVVFLGVVKTAFFFHTIDEVILGYSVSLIVQVPLAWLQCAGDSRSNGKRRLKDKDGGNVETDRKGEESLETLSSVASFSSLSSLSSINRSIRTSLGTGQDPPNSAFGWARQLLFPEL